MQGRLPFGRACSGRRHRNARYFLHELLEQGQKILRSVAYGSVQRLRGRVGSRARISAILALWCVQQRSASGLAAAFLPALMFAAFSTRFSPSFCERSTAFLGPSFGFLDKQCHRITEA